MIESYKVAANLSITGNAEKVMQQFALTLKKATVQVEKMIKLMKPLSAEMKTLMGIMAPLAESIVAVSAGFSEFNQKSSVTARRFSSISSKAETARRELNMLATAAGRVNDNLFVGRMSHGGAGGGGGGGGGGGRRSNRLNPFIAGMGLHNPYLMGGLATSALLKHSFKSGMSYEQATFGLASQNIPGLNTSEITSFVENNPIRGVSKAAMVEALLDAASITKNKNEAELLAPMLAKMNYAAFLTTGNKEGKMSSTQLQAAMKVAEIVTGSKDAKVLTPALDMMFKTWLTTYGKITPSTFLSATRSMRGYAKGLDPQFFFYMLEPMIQEYGTRVGPMLAQFFQHMTAGRMTTAGADALLKLKLLDKKDYSMTAIQTIRSLGAKSIHGYELRSKQPFEWIDKFLIPAFEAQGLTKPEDMAPYLGQIYSASDLGFVNTYIQQRMKFQSNFQANKRTSGVETVIKEAQDRDRHAVALNNLSTAFENFSLALDKISSPAITKAMELITSFLNKLTAMISVIDDIESGNYLAAAAKLQSPATRIFNTARSGVKTASNWLSKTAHFLGFTGESGISGSLGGDLLAPGGSGKILYSKVDVHMNADKVGSAVVKSIARQHNSISEHGMTGSNISHYAQSNAVNSTGGYTG